ncbi:MAG: bifunctional hydroxymethylpyrimidine kinase/phosphomethylpyrimidine kinase [Verrucomicrobia bacterium]|nr:bifunctional hydroxymethylpyrimidine kinase/phosphomethylpyrimidine kinase [Verrucomicrobiota bacterium]MBU1908945.1 bifunctional hydroxymethylpyrimidine kinase/phosphomethylpyrimidine kinase [Verrucomicrobiota bacterium]
MSEKETVRLVVVGSTAIDNIETPWAKRKNLLGGSASYACAASSFFTSVGMVGVVGEDFPPEYMELYRRFGINLEGLQIKPGRTFRWAGAYEENMDERRTLLTELNVFATFRPELPPAYQVAPFLFLGNISPELQAHVLDQVRRPRFIIVDTMDLWITTAVEALRAVIGRVDLLTLNESEARHLSGKHSLIKASRRLLELGPKYVLIKKGEHGSVLFSRNGMFLMPAFPLEDVLDPTGAGDAFAGGFVGALAVGGRVNEAAIRKAMLYGSVVASFGVEAFSLERLSSLTREDIEGRAALFRNMCQVR